MSVETYTTANGSNMDEIIYREGLTIADIADDLRNDYRDWGYAYISDHNGDTIAMITR